MLRHVLPRRLRLHLAVDKEDAAVLADVEGVTVGEPLLHEDAVGLGRLLRGVAEDRVVEAERFGELAVGLGVIAGGGEVGDVEGPDLGAAGTQRLALGGSPAGERLREPGDDERPSRQIL